VPRLTDLAPSSRHEAILAFAARPSPGHGAHDALPAVTLTTIRVRTVIMIVLPME